jgi:hypothetical protein
MPLPRLLLCLAIVGCGVDSTAKLPANLEARVTQEGVRRRAADIVFRYTEASGRRGTRWEDRRASIVVTPTTVLIYKNAKIGLEITPRTRRDVAVERDGRRIKIRAGQGRSEELWSFEPPDGDVAGWAKDLRTVMQQPAKAR